MIKRKFSVKIDPIEVPSRNDIINGRVLQAQAYLSQAADRTTKVHNDVEAMLAGYSVEQARALLARVIEDKFLASILSEEEITFAPAVVDDATHQELVLAVGTDDGVERDQIVDVFIKTGLIVEDAIRKIRVIKRRSFVEVPREVASDLMNALKFTMIAGRRVRLAVAESDQRGGSDRGSSYGRPSRGGSRYSGSRQGGRSDRGRRSR